MSRYYETDRISRLKHICPTFNKHVREGDDIAFGIKGDDSFPSDYENNRPYGRVVKVKNVGTENAAIRVRMNDTGRTVDIAPHNVDPRRVWEWTDASFEKVLERSRPAAVGPTAEIDAAPFRGATQARDDVAELMELRAKVDALSARIDEDSKQTEKFNGALISSFSELASEVSNAIPGTGSTPFSDILSKEYRGMMKNGGQLPRRPPSPFESDFSDSSEY